MVQSRSASRQVFVLLGFLLAATFSLLATQLTATASAKGGGVSIASKTFSQSGMDDKTRYTVGCPGNRKRVVPFGGGMITDPPGPDGEGAYPHSYERLGVQGGYHVTSVLYDPTPPTSAHTLTLQVACGPKQKHVTPPHTTTYVDSGQSKTITATCPGRRQLFGGGFQRTDFTSKGGDYVTESHALNSKTWVVSGKAYGLFGGELTAIAYCRRSGKPLVTEVASAPVPVEQGKFANAVTPPCPGKLKMTFGGFRTDPLGSSFYTGGGFDPSGGFSGGAFNQFGPAGTVTAYGYCGKAKKK